MNTIAHLMVILNEKGEIVDFYNTIDGIGWDEKEVIGKNWFDIFIDPVDREKIFKVFQEIIAGNEATYNTYKNDILCKNGTHKLIDFYNRRIDKDGSKYTFSVGVEHIDADPILLQELGEYVFKNNQFFHQ